MKPHILLILALLLAVPLSIYSVPAKPGVKKTLTLADGTKVVAELVGDEHGHYWLATDGKAYGVLPGKVVYREVDAKKIMEDAHERRVKVNSQRVKRLAQRRANKSSIYTGKKKGLIILANFDGTKFKKKHTRDYFERIVNEKNFHDGDFKGSVYDYFYDQSIMASERFEITFDVVGPYDLPHKHNYYGEQVTDGKGNVERYDNRAGEMIGDAINAAINDPTITLDFSKYDWDGDKYVDMIFVLYAGKGQADSGIEDTVWPHERKLPDGDYFLQIGDYYINSYACGNELNKDGDIAGIGTICHEFSHCLGFPDFYDTKNDKLQGMGNWDLMAKGSYNGNSYQPAGFTSYERWVAGWENPTVLTRSESVSGMRSLQKGGGSYIIRNPGHYDEYYLLENRQKTGWDASLPGFGMLIVHVDYDKKAWDGNDVNIDPDHQRMTWMPADARYDNNDDGKYKPEDMATDTYPQPNNNTFNKDSNPSASLYHPNTNGELYLDSSVENITQNRDGTISFDYVYTDNLCVTALVFENWYPSENYFDGTTLKGSVTLQNISDRNANEKIYVYLVDTDNHVGRHCSININMAPNDIVDYDFKFLNLVVGHTYYVVVKYESGIELIRSENMLCKDEKDTGETIEGNENLASFEYWFDDDYDTRVEVMLNNNRETVKESIYPDFLDDGVHRLNFRVKRNDGWYSSVSSSTFLKLPREQESRLDYWLDDDIDNKQTLEIENTEDEQLLTLDFSDNAKFPIGFHKLNMKMTLKGSLSGTVVSQGIMKLPGSYASELEYWFDNDIANAKRLTGKRAEAGDPGFIYINQLDLSALPVGIHTINFRAVSPSGPIKSSVFSHPVMRLPGGVATELEYWFDGDMAHSHTISGSGDAMSLSGCLFAGDIDLSGITPGHHRLYYRAKGNGGKTTAIGSAAIMVKSEYGAEGDATMASYSIVVDGETVSFGQLEPQQEVEFNYVLDSKELALGEHQLKATFWNSFGLSVTEQWPFQVVEVTKLNGDVNGDTNVDVADIATIIDVMAGKETGFAQAADANGDGHVDVADIADVISIMAARARAAGANMEE